MKSLRVQWRLASAWQELVAGICGHGQRDDEFIGYLKTNYSDLYGIAL